MDTINGAKGALFYSRDPLANEDGAYLGYHGRCHQRSELHPQPQRNSPRFETTQQYALFMQMLTNPSVLYSHGDQAWKIADFGLTTEGTSGRAHTTHYSRGTSSYRAPELVEYDKRTYTNKVDIWAIGCILYELVLGRKAFRTDDAVNVYARQFAFSGVTLPLLIDFETFPDQGRKSFVSRVIHEMLEVDANKRPRADELYTKFTCWGVDSLQRIPAPYSMTPVSPEGTPPVHRSDLCQFLRMGHQKL
jgi:serine/threonine protein kinase